ncbi:MAG: hypothetical protein PW789_14370 [Edaphobacter sp.]|uniref:hypothetical protein n=1 Tax=Edaphobacter sp. TaxID=1934404 RepID=UPI00238FBAF2|nr:hypothetical protein [Edaphobacter sp.]MDE1177765.1 hypothetical protein [Edaphobacter sp.]
MTEPIESTRNDPTPEERVGDSKFLPVIVAAGVALIVILLAAVIFVKSRGKEIVPDKTTPPSSQVILQAPATRAA